MSGPELKSLAAGAQERADRAAAAIADLARDTGLLDVAVGTVGSPIGDLTIAVTSRGLARVAFDDEDRESVLHELASKLSPRVLESRLATQDWRRELEEYFLSRRTRFDLPIDRRLIHGIARGVLSATARIPFGLTTTYGELARRIGNPRAARAVGNALGSNPIPVVIPCHRVLRAGGELGGYGGGVDRKEWLLRLEAALPQT